MAALSDPERLVGCLEWVGYRGSGSTGAVLRLVSLSMSATGIDRDLTLPARGRRRRRAGYAKFSALLMQLRTGWPATQWLPSSSSPERAGQTPWCCPFTPPFASAKSTYFKGRSASHPALNPIGRGSEVKRDPLLLREGHIAERAFRGLLSNLCVRDPDVREQRD
jgi:hypothetical protein